ncbi:MAG: M20/M25/M40 family metallo-hydrolase [Myxococcales bacterium]|nr:M20/M25/M40 family metallo-hydrolase [Myxococcales bacterium]
MRRNAPLARRAAPLACLALLAIAVPARAESSAIERLAAALRLETISPADPADFRGEPFLALHRHLEESFPLVHERLEREIVSEYSLLYTWAGADAAAAPILLTSHLDVVPVPEGTESSWEQPPFAGVVADGYLWGRGTLDDKFGVLATLEAVERLLAAGFAPTRTIHLAFGHDEEIGGEHGAGAITKRLEDQGVRFAWSLDEGMAVISGVFPSLSVPSALIGVAEKGYLTIELTARADGGHSSMPPREGAIGRLARAVGRLEASPMPADMETIAGRTLDALAPHVDGVQGLVLRNRRLLGPVVERALSRKATTDALLRTTTAVTMVRAGVKENILPRSATATVNFRLLPGDTVEEVLEHVRQVVDDPEIEITAGTGNPASEVASTGSEGYADLVAAIGAVYPDAVVAPGLVLGGTDSRHYGRIADDAYRFAPLDLDIADSARIHGVNERIGVENYARCIDFYEALIRESAGP